MTRRGAPPRGTVNQLRENTMRKHIWIVGLAFALSGCFIVGGSKTKTSSQPAAVQEEPKNHGQERAAEVHERNEERKEAHDAQKAEDKAAKDDAKDAKKKK